MPHPNTCPRGCALALAFALLLIGRVAAAPIAAPEPLPAQRTIAPGPFGPNWDSLTANYKCPEWFRDAKLGIWAHWGPQCVPGEGDWYARSMYLQGHKQYDAHVAAYGHPSEFGFMEIDNLWKAERWNPDELLQLFVEAGARYFVAMATHEDNFDAFASRYHAWNSVNVGPKRDIIGEWARAARARGLRFGVSNHSSHAWHWFQTAYGYDAEGPKAGERYDAFRLKKEDGKGKWWDGLDPQDLYGRPQPGMVIPDGIQTVKELRAWHDAHNLPWTEEPPPGNPEFVNNWFFRVQDLLDKYQPDFFYLDNTELPLGQAGLDIAAHFYNAAIARHGGKLDAVLTAKGLRAERRPAVVQDFERSIGQGGVQELPFETGTCIGQWHYKKDIDYKTVTQVVRNFVDVVSKNGTLLLSIPMRGDGTIDDRERAFLKGLAAWNQVNGEAIFGSRPWKIHGEGPTQIPRGRAADGPLPFTSEDIRFTTNHGALYAFVLKLPEAAVRVKALGTSAPYGAKIASISLVGSTEAVTWRQEADALVIEKPAQFPCADVIAYKITLQ
jgi:alpha-L-fucosidase